MYIIHLFEIQKLIAGSLSVHMLKGQGGFSLALECVLHLYQYTYQKQVLFENKLPGQNHTDFSFLPKEKKEMYKEVQLLIFTPSLRHDARPHKGMTLSQSSSSTHNVQIVQNV